MAPDASVIAADPPVVRAQDRGPVAGPMLGSMVGVLVALLLVEGVTAAREHS